ncbi:MAG: hypothetical protein JJV97_00315 [SAR324 cluster bacterium]|nr:hypothetical protein [SAR324 cluster bacterium]
MDKIRENSAGLAIQKEYSKVPTPILANPVKTETFDPPYINSTRKIAPQTNQTELQGIEQNNNPDGANPNNKNKNSFNTLA